MRYSRERPRFNLRLISLRFIPLRLLDAAMSYFHGKIPFLWRWRHYDDDVIMTMTSLWWWRHYDDGTIFMTTTSCLMTSFYDDDIMFYDVTFYDVVFLQCHTSFIYNVFSLWHLFWSYDVILLWRRILRPSTLWRHVLGAILLLVSYVIFFFLVFSITRIKRAYMIKGLYNNSFL